MEAIGDAATGAVLAGAVEPGTGTVPPGHTHEGKCLNCGSELLGDYCHECGQRAHVHRTLAAFWHDLIHGILHFDGKIWRTLPMLAWRPGELTRRYIHGERASFVSPVALFLFTVFMMFALFSAVGVGVDASKLHNTKSDVNAALEKEREDLRELRDDRAEALRKGDAAAATKSDRQIRDTQKAIAALDQFVAVSSGYSSDMVGGRTGWQRIDDGVKKLNANPALAIYKLQTNAYKYSWALIPISVPFVWLLFLHRRRYRQFGAYDHTIFVTYSITFMSFALIVIVLLTQIPNTGWLRNAMIVIPPIHMYRQLRGAYGLSRASAAWRAVALIGFAGLAITLFMLLLAALGIVG